LTTVDIFVLDSPYTAYPAGMLTDLMRAHTFCFPADSSPADLGRQGRNLRSASTRSRSRHGRRVWKATAAARICRALLLLLLLLLLRLLLRLICVPWEELERLVIPKIAALRVILEGFLYFFPISYQSPRSP